MSARRVLAPLAAAALLVLPHAAHADTFTYDPPGKLVPGSGKGRADDKVYAPGIRFPIETGPAFANSQVWGRGGANGGGGSQCDAENFSYPWHDNYCETRDWDMPLCPAGQGHQGQDIRAADCKKGVHWTVAVVDGTITSIGSYSVYLTAADGTRFDYLHQEGVVVKVGEKVKRGQHIGKVSNQFDGTPTTVHLHFNIKQNVAGVGSVYVPTYLSLVQSYEELLGIRSSDAGAPDGSVDRAPAPPAPAAQETPVAEAHGDDPEGPSDDGGCAISPGAARSWIAPALAALALVLGRLLLRRPRK
jgi:murein DD-endopeptidase MepM/ murein hydrolase activator NlpD